jgi:hypothetical protein
MARAPPSLLVSHGLLHNYQCGESAVLSRTLAAARRTDFLSPGRRTNGEEKAALWLRAIMPFDPDTLKRGGA